MSFPSPSSVEAVIAVENLSRRFQQKTALDAVSLYVPRGCVCGLVGENGAGKTTLIKHLLGLLRAESGSARVFGLDPTIHRVEVLSRLGYLSENRDLPGWMRVTELLRYTEAFYPQWDGDYAEQLRAEFDLPLPARVSTLSQGQQAKLGLLLALAYRPELLVLDEPSSGLDPLVRREMLEAIIRAVAEEGRTVLFSSHLLDEVERVSDHLAMLHQGRLVFTGPLDQVRQSHRRLVIQFAEGRSAAPNLPGALSEKGFGREWTIVCGVQAADTVARATELGGVVIEEQTATIEEIFLARAGQGP